MKKQIKGVLIKVKPDGHTTVSTMFMDDTLDMYYKELNCTTIDIVSRRIGDKYYDIVCDDEALLKDNPICSAYDGSYKPALYGNIFICNPPTETSNGYCTSLTEQDLTNVWNNIMIGKVIIRY